MLGSRVLSSVLKRNKQTIGNTISSIGRTSPQFSRQHFKELSTSPSRPFFHAFRSLPKGGHNAGSIRNSSTVASVSLESKEGVKLLVTAGPRAQKMVGIWLFGSAAWVFSMVNILGGVTRLTRSGLSMTNWKFTGQLPPLSDEE
ncbi:unnamed protein product [Linum tenue]|uniref:Uncharacterized protein n=1 Tax=Linum tenue TaxID=586396 RepID=A0AAV0ILG0_9ROSI|nr:unnamed protein product [Linum tenue]